MKSTHHFIWTVFFVLILPLVGYAVYSGLLVGEMELPGGFRIVFREPQNGKTSSSIEKRLDSLSESELEKRQAKLEQRLRELEQEANKSDISSQPQNINLSGTWFGQTGVSYQIMQNGNFLTIQEINPLYGITAVGQGQIQGQSVQIRYQTAAYTQGSAQLTISANGRSLNGYFRDNYSGLAVPANLSR